MLRESRLSHWKCSIDHDGVYGYCVNKPPLHFHYDLFQIINLCHYRGKVIWVKWGKVNTVFV